MNFETDPRLPELLEAMRAGDRAAAADFMDRFGPRIKARIRVGLSRGMRRVFDSQDLLSTVSRRLDAMVRSGSLRAANEQQLWSLVFTIAEHSLAEKGRIIRRLKRVEGPDSEFAHRLLGRLQDEMAISDAYLEISNIFNAIDDVTDKQILTLWLNDMTPARIGECLGMPRKTVNWRWSRIRDTLKGALGA